MVQILVDIDDLEKLVFGAGALKAIEAALDQQKRDPFVKQHLPITEAHNRLASAVRHARRNPDDTVVNPHEPLTEDERKALLWVGLRGKILTPEMKVPKDKDEVMSVYDRLAAKAYVVMGQLVRGVIWAGESTPELVVDPTGFGIKLTPKGAILANERTP